MSGVQGVVGPGTWTAGKPAERQFTGRMLEIREAALTLFSERGYYGTGMEDIARVVGIRASSLYNHLPSKQILLADIMLTTMRELIRVFDESIKQAQDSADPAAELRLAMEVHVRYHATHRRDVRVGNREIASLEEQHQREVRQQRRTYARRWQAMIERGINTGAFATPSAQLSTYALLEMGIGVSQWFQEGGPLTLDEIADHYAEMALRQLGADVESTHGAARAERKSARKKSASG